MWFKNVIAYRLTAPFNYDETQLEEKLSTQQFTPCGSQELSRYGWISPSNNLVDVLTHSVHGFYMIAAQKEEKILPPAVVRQMLEDKVSSIEHEQARKIYRKERDQLKDEIILDLLPRAFSRLQQTRALIAPQQGWIFVDASSHKKAEELLSYLRGTLGTLPVALPDVKHSPSAIMSHWLEDVTQRPTGLDVQDEAELRDNLVENGVIRIKGQELASDEFVAHLEAGKRVVKLSVEWEEQLRFIIQEDLSLKRLKLTDRMKEQMDQESDGDQLAVFDADMAQMGIELTRLFPALLESFGGLAEAP